MELELFLQCRLSDNQKRLDFVRRELEQCCEGRLTEERKNGKVHFIQTINADGHRLRRGITTQPEKIKSLIRRRVFSKEAEFLLSEQKAINSIRTSLQEFDLSTELDFLKKNCPGLTEDIIFDALYLRTNEEWQNATYEKSDYKPEMRKHITSRGLRVRSKSELLIAEKLYEYDIPFHYEQVLRIQNVSMVPDFTIRRNDGKIFFWEHEGLTNVREYIEWQKHKGELYASAGIVPWDNLIVTYDSADGLIDIRIIESEIKNKLIV